jgi:hypothetical protein
MEWVVARAVGERDGTGVPRSWATSTSTASSSMSAAGRSSPSKCPCPVRRASDDDVSNSDAWGRRPRSAAPLTSTRGTLSACRFLASCPRGADRGDAERHPAQAGRQDRTPRSSRSSLPPRRGRHRPRARLGRLPTHPTLGAKVRIFVAALVETLFSVTGSRATGDAPTFGEGRRGSACSPSVTPSGGGAEEVPATSSPRLPNARIDRNPSSYGQQARRPDPPAGGVACQMLER